MFTKRNERTARLNGATSTQSRTVTHNRISNDEFFARHSNLIKVRTV